MMRRSDGEDGSRAAQVRARPVPGAGRGRDRWYGESLVGETRDISVGGVFIERVSVALGKRVTVHVTPTGAFESIRLPGVVRWVGTDGVGVQFGLLGARETHLITEIIAARDTE